jgi:hypothetical protein
MNDEKIQGVTPTGRMLAGAIFSPTDKGYQGKTLSVPIYYLQLAVPKGAAGLDKVFADMKRAAADFRNDEPNRADFSWKCKDGDDPKYADREGAKGCYIFTFRSEYPPRAIIDKDFTPIIDPNRIKPGYQIRVSYTMKGNNNLDKPGIFSNLHMVKLVAEDAIIISGPSPRDIFGQGEQVHPFANNYKAQTQGSFPQAPVQGSFPQAQTQGSFPQAPVQGSFPQAPIRDYSFLMPEQALK